MKYWNGGIKERKTNFVSFEYLFKIITNQLLIDFIAWFTSIICKSRHLNT